MCTVSCLAGGVGRNLTWPLGNWVPLSPKTTRHHHHFPTSQFAHDLELQSHGIMKFTLLVCSLLSLLVSEAAATALTYKLGSSEKACFYAVTKKEAEKIAFYFAVRKHPSHRFLHPRHSAQR